MSVISAFRRLRKEDTRLWPALTTQGDLCLQGGKNVEKLTLRITNACCVPINTVPFISDYREKSSL
jgi:hypothetical protein